MVAAAVAEAERAPAATLQCKYRQVQNWHFDYRGDHSAKTMRPGLIARPHCFSGQFCQAASVNSPFFWDRISRIIEFTARKKHIADGAMAIRTLIPSPIGINPENHQRYSNRNPQPLRRKKSLAFLPLHFLANQSMAAPRSAGPAYMAIAVNMDYKFSRQLRLPCGQPYFQSRLYPRVGAACSAVGEPFLQTYTRIRRIVVSGVTFIQNGACIKTKVQVRLLILYYYGGGITPIVNRMFA